MKSYLLPTLALSLFSGSVYANDLCDQTLPAPARLENARKAMDADDFLMADCWLEGASFTSATDRREASMIQKWADSQKALHPNAQPRLSQAAASETTSLTFEAQPNRRKRTSDELVMLYSNSAIHGALMGGWFAAVTEMDSVSGVSLSLLSGLSLGVTTAVLLDNVGEPLHYGVPSSYSAGMEWGWYQSLVWTAFIDSLDDHANHGLKLYTTMPFLGGTLGAVGGYFAGEKLYLTPGQARALSSSTAWGMFTGLLFAEIVNGSNILDSDDNNVKYGFLSMGIGSLLGTVGGYFLGQEAQPTQARVNFTSLGGAIGAGASSLIYLLAAGLDNENDISARGLALASGLGMATGLTLGWFLAKDSPDRPDNALSWHLNLAPIEDGMMAGFAGRF